MHFAVDHPVQSLFSKDSNNKNFHLGLKGMDINKMDG